MAKGKTKQGGGTDPVDPLVPDPTSSDDKDDAKEETPTGAKARTAVIQHIIKLCGFAADSTMVSYIDQEQWKTVFDMITLHVSQIDDFEVIRDDGKFDAKPMLKDRRMLTFFLLYYQSRCVFLLSTLDDNELLTFTR